MRQLLSVLLVLSPFYIYAQSPANTNNLLHTDTVSYPSLTKEWTAAEFETVLTDIVSRQQNKNPVYISSDKRTGLYTKITSYNNYNFLEHNNTDINDRIPASLALSALTQKLILGYYVKGLNSNKKFVYDKEIADCMNLLCAMNATQSKLMDAFVAITPNLDSVQLNGIEKMKAGHALMIGGLLITIDKEYSLYSEPSICKVAATAKNFYLSIRDKMKAEVRDDYDARIMQIAKKHSNECVRKAITIEK